MNTINKNSFYNVKIIDKKINITTTIDGGLTPEPDLFFSEYGEGTSNNKYFEIFNPTSELKKLDDYAILYHSRSRLWYNFTLNETLTNGSVYIVCTNQANDSIKTHANVQLAYPSVAYFNGDDTLQIVKKKSGSENFSASGMEGIDFEVTDSIGDRNDPGSGWAVAGTSNATGNHTLVRKSSITTGNSDWDASRGTTVENSEWIVYPKNTWSYLGSHTMSEPDKAPVFTNTVSEYKLYKNISETIDLSSICNDPDGDAISFSGSVSDSNVLSFNIDTNILTFTGLSLGTSKITIVATANDLTATLVLSIGIVPQITLIGDSVINIEKKSIYIDYGVKVEDNYEFNTLNNVNTLNIGTYAVTYTVTLGSFTESKTRTVNVKETYNTLSTKISDLNNSITQLKTFNVKAGWNYIKPTNDASMPTDSNIVDFYKYVPGKKPELVSSGLLEKDNIYIVECKSDGTLTLL